MPSRLPLIDGHNDLPWELREKYGSDVDKAGLAGRVPDTHTDIPRLVEGEVGGQFWSVYVPASLAGDSAVTAVFEQVDLVHRMVARHPDRFQLATCADEVDAALAAGKIASLLGAEGGHCMVDLSHVAVSTMNDALDDARAPVIFSHSSARALTDNPRNVPDDVLGRLAGNGGVCMVTFVPFFVSQDCTDWFEALKGFAAGRGLDPGNLSDVFGLLPEWEKGNPLPAATLAQVADHVEHVRAVAGIDHVGIGGDFDGTPVLPQGLADVSRYPALFHELRRRRWSEPELRALAAGNILRVLRAADAYASAAGG